mmetsp:Transcript_5297/g.16812  ORF Transcript_5297/g.16812 Transcript_5297/m.16812 type:complete len:106 (+) Transcript_5297:81-398(+)
MADVAHEESEDFYLGQRANRGRSSDAALDFDDDGASPTQNGGGNGASAFTPLQMPSTSVNTQHSGASRRPPRSLPPARPAASRRGRRRRSGSGRRAAATGRRGTP